MSATTGAIHTVGPCTLVVDDVGILPRLKGDGLPTAEFDLAFADPPWLHDQRFGKGAAHKAGDGAAVAADGRYAGLPLRTIAAHLDHARWISNRLVLWTTWVHLGPWLAYDLLRGLEDDDPLDLLERLADDPNPRGGVWPVTGGAWHKHDDENAGHYGQGFHWAGCTEPVLVYRWRGRGYCSREAPLRNGWHERPTAHSRKPVVWQAAMIRRWVPPRGKVLDLYAGLGSVAEAVLLAGEGREYFGFEIDPTRAERAVQNMQHRHEKVLEARR